MNALFCTAVMLLLLVGTTQTCEAEVACRGANNEPVEPPNYRTKCQTEEFEYSLCGDPNNPGDHRLHLHVLLRHAEIVTAVNVTNRDDEYVQHVFWSRPNCPDVLHVRVLRPLRQYISAVVMVETQHEVRHYAMFFFENPSIVHLRRDWLMALGYILTVTKPTNDSAVTVSRLAAIVSRPRVNSTIFSLSTVRVSLRDTVTEFWSSTRHMSECSGVWCMLELVVRQADSPADRQLPLMEKLLLFEYNLPGQYKNKYNVNTPQHLRVADQRNWRQRRDIAQKSGDFVPAARDAGSIESCITSETPSFPSLTLGTVTIIIIVASVMLSLGSLVALIYWRRQRKAALKNTRSSIIVVISPNVALIQGRQLILENWQRRLRSHGYRLIIKDNLDVRRLRGALAESRIFILVDGEAQIQKELKLLTIPESRYELLSGGDAMGQLNTSLNDFLALQIDNEFSIETPDL